jgi:hypothetical protein
MTSDVQVNDPEVLGRLSVRLAKQRDKLAKAKQDLESQLAESKLLIANLQEKNDLL